MTSPVTPGPTDADIRLAELAAGLVVAGDAKARQEDTIRRLADELEMSQKRVRKLEANAPSSSRKERKPRSGRGAQTPRRAIRFTPAATERPGDETEMRRRGRSSSTNRPVEREVRTEHSSSELRSELAALKRERAQEQRSLTKMFSDIKQNTGRVLQEREKHLAIIASLRQEIDESKRKEVEIARQMDQQSHDGSGGSSISVPSARDRTLPPVPLFRHKDDQRASPSKMRSEGRRSSPSSVRDLTLDSKQTEDGTSAGPPSIEGNDGYDSDLPKSTEDELRQELSLALQENRELFTRVQDLEAECHHLSESRRRAENVGKSETPHAQSKPNRHACTAIRVQAAEISEALKPALAGLVDEVDILESVAEAINFQVSPSEVERLQDTMSTLSVSSDETARVRPAHARQGAESLLRNVVRRLEHIRSELSVRYGQWLTAVVAEDSSTLNLSDGSSENETDTFSSVNTKVIQELLQ